MTGFADRSSSRALVPGVRLQAGGREELHIKRYSFEEMLEEQGYIVYTNIGESMLPLLRQKKDIVEIRKKETGRCRKYDMVLYKRNSQYILHRILKVLPDGYVIAGDHNLFLEYDIADEQILGVVTRVVRDGKSINMTDKKYLFYVHLWCDFYPVRILILRIKALIRRLLNQDK